jgi:translation elongation factor EF-Tu-like GTPase
MKRHRAKLQVRDSSSLIGRGVVVVGVLLEGAIKLKMKTMANGKTGEVRLIEYRDEVPDEFDKVGSDVSVLIHGMTKEDIIGSVLFFD